MLTKPDTTVERKSSIFTVLILILLGSCSEPPPIDWDIDFEPRTLINDGYAIEAVIKTGGCESDEIRYSTVLYLLDEQPEGSVLEPDPVNPGRYGFAARAWNTNCRYYASGCTEVELSDDSSRVMTILEFDDSITDPRCPEELCDSGVCRTYPDADIDDSDVSDSDVEADVDDPIDPCNGECETCEDCVEENCVTSADFSWCEIEESEGFCLQNYMKITECCTATLDGGETIIDDTSTCILLDEFLSWDPEVSGYENHLFKLQGINDSKLASTAEWHFKVGVSGNYKIEVYTMGWENGCKEVVYEIKLPSGVFKTNPIDHSLREGWVSLETYYFSSEKALSWVRVSNTTDEVSKSDKWISFDAIKLTFQ